MRTIDIYSIDLYIYRSIYVYGENQHSHSSSCLLFTSPPADLCLCSSYRRLHSVYLRHLRQTFPLGPSTALGRSSPPFNSIVSQRRVALPASRSGAVGPLKGSRFQAGAPRHGEDCRTPEASKRNFFLDGVQTRWDLLPASHRNIFFFLNGTASASWQRPHPGVLRGGTSLTSAPTPPPPPPLLLISSDTSTL